MAAPLIPEYESDEDVLYESGISLVENAALARKKRRSTLFLLVLSVVLSIILVYQWVSEGRRSGNSGEETSIKIVNTIVSNENNRVFTKVNTINDSGLQRNLNGQLLRLRAPTGAKKQECRETFNDWLLINRKTTGTLSGKRNRLIPYHKTREFLMFGFAIFQDWYIDERKASKPITWTTSKINYWINKTVSRDWSVFTYTEQCAAVFTAIASHPPKLNGEALVVGSRKPWAESIALHVGKARHVVTAEYTRLVSQDTRITVTNPVTMAENWENYHNRFDFAITYSSIEHSGLGRYGEATDPFGDLREMEKLRCFLKRGGLLYLGLPSGIDTLTWNAHRIYGSVRYPLMMAGWKHLATFIGTDTKPTKLSETWKNYTMNHRNQPVVVLQKLLSGRC